MMVALGLIVSALAPLLAGVPWFLALQHERGPGVLGIALGYGYAAGVLLIVAAIHVLSLAHVPLNVFSIAVIPLAVGAVGWWRVADAPVVRLRSSFSAARQSWMRMSRPTRIVCVTAAGLIIVRMITLAIETVSRPLFPWEAVSGVAAKAHVWYELGMLVPFGSPGAMLEGATAFTDADPNALSLPSLLLVWTASAIGQWQEGAVGFAWWMLGAALGAAFWGHLRRVGAGPALALCFTYVLVSLPLVDINIALSGAPQWIGAAGMGLAGCAFLRWLSEPAKETFACAAIGMIIAAASLASTWPWLFIFLIATGIARFERASTRIAVGVPVAAVVALLAWMQTPLTLSGMPLRLQVAPEWSETPESLLLLDNWHLLFGVLLLVLIAGRKLVFAPPWRPRTWVVAMGLGLMAVRGMLALQPWWLGGLRDFSYAGLQLAPMLLFWMAWVVHDLAPAVRHRPEVRAAPPAPADAVSSSGAAASP